MCALSDGCLDIRSIPVYNTCHKILERSVKQAQLGVPHTRIQVELGFILQAGTCDILNFVQNPRQSQSVQCTELN